MPKIMYKAQRFSRDNVLKIEHAEQIIREYQAQGFMLTLRQLYYQFVARGIIANSQKEYNKLGVVINNARLAGLLDWEAIEDRSRHVDHASSWSTSGDIVATAAMAFRLDRWTDQLERVEVWIEKDALAGVLTDVCDRYHVALLSNRGYLSQSEMWRAAIRFQNYESMNGQDVTIIHLGDYDPSGIDMTRDIKDRLVMFDCPDVEVERIALNWDQVQHYQPPPNPAKTTDSRFAEYMLNYGIESWELDALDPDVIVTLTEDAILGHLDQQVWADMEQREAEQRAQLEHVSANWDKVVKDNGPAAK